LQAFKVSLHSSGIWRIAFVEELKRENMETDRLILKWNKPEEIAPGWTPSIAISVSSIQPLRPFGKVAIDDSRITWIAKSAEGKRMIFMILMSTDKMSEVDLRRILNSTDKLVGSIIKKNSEKVWLVYRGEDLSSNEENKIREVMKNTLIHLKAGSSEDSTQNSRAILVVSEDAPTNKTQPLILDISLGKENLDITKE